MVEVSDLLPAVIKVRQDAQKLLGHIWMDTRMHALSMIVLALSP